MDAISARVAKAFAPAGRAELARRVEKFMTGSSSHGPSTRPSPSPGEREGQPRIGTGRRHDREIVEEYTVRRARLTTAVTHGRRGSWADRRKLAVALALGILVTALIGFAVGVTAVVRKELRERDDDVVQRSNATSSATTLPNSGDQSPPEEAASDVAPEDTGETVVAALDGDALSADQLARFENGRSTLYREGEQLNLRVCADNLSGREVRVHTVRLGRDLGRRALRATSECVTFIDLEGPGPLLDATYFTRAALDGDPSPEWPAPCHSHTAGYGLCDEYG